MAEWVSYIELAEQYERSAQLTYDMICKWTEKLHSAQHNAQGEEAYRIKNELITLYTMRREALETANILRTYGKEKEAASTISEVQAKQEGE